MADGRVVQPLNPFSKGCGFEITFRPVRNLKVSVITGKRSKGVTSFGHIERKD